MILAICMLLLLLLFLGGLLLVASRLLGRFSYPKNPYTGLPLRRAEELPFRTRLKIHSFLKANETFHNRPIRFKRALFCRETGRLFPGSIDWKGKMRVDWTFLLKRYRGHWISWGSLSEELKRRVKERHTKIEGFQTERSSPEPSPMKISSLYAYSRPGPLYVDLEEMLLLGWKVVPETEIEVLVLQKPDR